MEALQEAPSKWAKSTDDVLQVVENADYLYAHNSIPEMDDEPSAVNKYK